MLNEPCAGLTAASSQTEITRELDRLEESISNLQEVLQTLISKMSPAMRSSVPTQEKDIPSNDQTPYTDLGRALRVKTTHIKDLVDVIVSANNRIEL